MTEQRDMSFICDSGRSVTVTDKKGRKYIGDVDYIIWNVTIKVAGLYLYTKKRHSTNYKWMIT